MAPDGVAIGVMGDLGRAVDRARGAGYVIETWLANDGDAADQAEAAVRPGVDRAAKQASAALSNGWRLVLLEGLVRPDRMAAACVPRTVLVAPAARQPGVGPCLSFDRAALDRLGAGYRFETRLATVGPVVGGVLKGDLILQGGGDPELDSVGLD